MTRIALSFQPTWNLQVLKIVHCQFWCSTNRINASFIAQINEYFTMFCSCRWWQLLWMPWTNKLHVGENWRLKTNTCIFVIPSGSCTCFQLNVNYHTCKQCFCVSFVVNILLRQCNKVGDKLKKIVGYSPSTKNLCIISVAVRSRGIFM